VGLLNAAAKAELAKGMFHLAFAVELEFAGGVERYWSGIHPLGYDGESWVGTGSLGAGSIVLESSEDFHANGLQLGITGLPGDLGRNVRMVGAADYKGRGARFLMLLMAADWATVLWAHSRHYFMDTVDYSFEAESGGTVVVGLETEVRYGARKAVKRYSDQGQRSRFLGDRAFEFLAFINSGVEVKWGTEGAFFR